MMTEWEDILKEKRRKPPVKLVGAIDSMSEMGMKENKTSLDSNKELEDKIAEDSRAELINELVKMVNKLTTSQMRKLLVKTQGDFSKVV
tara:strand:+ start:265 stop:531 length:267 start_codon:yes stop_codon:yes gene_type:complete